VVRFKEGATPLYQLRPLLALFKPSSPQSVDTMEVETVGLPEIVVRLVVVLWTVQDLASGPRLHQENEKGSENDAALPLPLVEQRPPEDHQRGDPDPLGVVSVSVSVLLVSSLDRESESAGLFGLI